ncbi:retrovirus-related Pol polyprotein from transposon 17.6 [Trichonephila clavipes]|nr:retrovirus-related Pol polyprotein from transposon 17.6 [Trichonephila clavipes]
MKDHFLNNWANLKSATQIAELFDNYEDVRKINLKPMDRWGRNDKILTYSGVKEKENRFGKTSPRLGASVPEIEILNAVQTRAQVKAARKERGIDSGDAKKGEDEVIIVSSDAEDEILIPALQEYVPELALLRVTRENLINAQKNSEKIKSLYEQAASQVQVTNQRIKRAKLTIKPSKCKFAQQNVKFLGHIVGQGFRTPSEIKVQAVLEFHIPRTKTQIRAFLGLAGYYQKHINLLSVIASPLTDALKGRAKKGEINWTTEGEDAFRELKGKLID